jgi:DNA processing protein
MQSAEQRATLGLWSIRGVGPVTVGAIRKTLGPQLAGLLDEPVESWAPLVEMRADIFESVMQAGSLAASAERAERACRAHQARILFPEDLAFPSGLKDIPDAPAVLFAFGPAGDGPPRRKLAIVGTRSLEAGLERRIRDISREAAANGLCIVSGAAQGTDQAAHRGALDAKGQTWAFLGCALDEIDVAQQEITRQIIASGGTVLSEFPPGFRANKNTFKIRNRLISGASDAVLIFRAPIPSGALHTATYALEQRRPLFATPADPWCQVAKGSNDLLRLGLAKAHVDVNDLLEAVGLKGEVAKPDSVPQDLTGLGDLAKRVLTQLQLGAADFDGLLSAIPAIGSGELSAALVELEVFGAVVHKGGRTYEKR